MKILILKFRNIGDVLLISPLIANLREKYQNSTIDVAINEGTEEVLILNKNINDIIIFERDSIKSLPFLKKLFYEMRFYKKSLKKKYDIVINLTEGDRGSIISLLSRARLRFGYKGKSLLSKVAYNNFLPDQEFRHTIETNLDVLKILGFKEISKKVEIFWEKEDERVVASILKETQDFVHIHPVSRWLFKCVANETMAKIIDFCELELKRNVVITSAPNENEMSKVEQIIQLCRSKPLNISGQLSIKQTAALNKRAKLFIGVDTAIMHVSAANDIPTIAFFGPSGGDHWGPWDNNLSESSYITRNGIQIMGKHTIISEKRGCQPCGKDGCNGTKISDCLMSLDIEIIKKYIRKILID